MPLEKELSSTNVIQEEELTEAPQNLSSEIEANTCQIGMEV